MLQAVSWIHDMLTRRERSIAFVKYVFTVQNTQFVGLKRWKQCKYLKKSCNTKLNALKDYFDVSQHKLITLFSIHHFAGHCDCGVIE